MSIKFIALSAVLIAAFFGAILFIRFVSEEFPWVNPVSLPPNTDMIGDGIDYYDKTPIEEIRRRVRSRMSDNITMDFVGSSGEFVRERKEHFAAFMIKSSIQRMSVGNHDSNTLHIIFLRESSAIKAIVAEDHEFVDRGRECALVGNGGGRFTLYVVNNQRIDRYCIYSVVRSNQDVRW